MKVKVISDTHNKHQEIKDLECDILIHCGDFGAVGKFKEAESFLYWMVKQPARYKIVVRGNHDRPRKSTTTQNILDLANRLGITILRDEMIEIEGKKIYGNDYVPRVGVDGNYYQSKTTRFFKWKNVPTNLDILITHTPPFKILDTNLNGVHCGCDELYKRIKEASPRYHVFGHIHENGGNRMKLKNTTYINCASMDRKYKIVRGYQEFEI